MTTRPDRPPLRLVRGRETTAPLYPVSVALRWLRHALLVRHERGRPVVELSPEMAEEIVRHLTHVPTPARRTP